MRSLYHVTARLLRDRRAATAVEYGLILALIVISLMIGLIALGDASMNLWSNINDKVTASGG
ncbi:Flp family type IVb pilin [Sphingomonas sp. M1-B02]|uniref:Flp family type IVb pilin n=1 Tax=Sphingomonas sp. M1-B02 TaxID=3114300 RepID=UPI0022407C8E|nr:Flp family type IVb pilin [Sphingomonas sp. S6-11]UZK66373.1 Flp family type IVb pilin [Sphingomonas sp. S6-11]